MDDPMNPYKSILRKRGVRVERGTKYCEFHRSRHDNCKQCESEEGCKRLAHVHMIVLEGMMYKPSSYDDMVETNKKVDERIARTLMGENVLGKKVE